MAIKKINIGKLKIGDVFFLCENLKTHTKETELIVKEQPDYYLDCDLVCFKNKNINNGSFALKPTEEVFIKQ